jgi:hypothetical protein
LNGDGLANEVEAGRFRIEGVEVVFRSVGEIAIVVKSGYIRMYETVGGRDLAGFGLVQVSAYPPPTSTLLNAIGAFLASKIVPSISVAGIGAPTKLFQYVRLAQASLPVPETRYAPRPLLQDSYPSLAEELGLPFMLKALRYHVGAELIASPADLAERLREAQRDGTLFYAQAFIPADSVLRLFVFGRDVPLATRRHSLAMMIAGEGSDDDVLVDSAAIDSAARQLAIGAAAAMKLEIASVDLIQHWATGQWYVLEVSGTPAIYTGQFCADKLQAYSAYLKQRTRQGGLRLWR